MMTKFRDNFALAELFSTYESLLPTKQALYLNLYLNEDLSLQEIADNYQVSKNAVHDSIQKATTNLKKWEASLHLTAQQRQQEAIYQQFKESTNPEVQAILTILKEE